MTQYYLYRVTVGEATRTILATGEAAAVKQSGGTCAVELHPYPMMLLEDMRKEWPQLRQSDEGIEVVRKWMRAAREIGLIDAEQHARMFEVVEAAKEARL